MCFLSLLSGGLLFALFLWFYLQGFMTNYYILNSIRSGMLFILLRQNGNKLIISVIKVPY